MFVPQSDEEFSDWLSRHPNGYVVNTDEPPEHYNRLHRASCQHLRSSIRKNFAGGEYRKTCSADVAELRALSPNLGGQLVACGTCNPFLDTAPTRAQH